MSVSVYPAIDPRPHFAAQTYRNKVVLITGASRGIGAETALAYARAGASIAILARWKKTLDERAAEIRSSVPSAQVLVVPADVRDVQAVDTAVQVTLSRFGRIDIVVANAGTATNISKCTSVLQLETRAQRPSFTPPSSSHEGSGWLVEYL